MSLDHVFFIFRWLVTVPYNAQSNKVLYYSSIAEKHTAFNLLRFLFVLFRKHLYDLWHNFYIKDAYYTDLKRKPKTIQR